MQVRQAEAMAGLAVVAAVMAARYQPVFLFYPVYAFAAAFLCLAAGFAAPERPREALRAAAGLAGLAWVGTAVAAAAAMGLAGAGLTPPGRLPSGAADLAAVSLLAPLGLAEAPGLFPAGWLFAGLAAGSALLAVLRPAAQRAVGAWAGSLAAALITLLAAGERPLQPGPRLLAARLAFALAFFLAGAALRGASERTARRLRAPALLCGGFVLVDALAVNLGALGSRLELGSLGAGGLWAFLATAVIALMGASVAWYAAQVVPARSALLGVGRAWRAVLALSAAVLFAVDLCFVAAGRLRAAELPDAARAFKLDRWWLLYLVPAIALPALLAWGVSRLRRARVPGGAP
jgi:hypothetical protein